jgi:ABC-type transport system involved in multi-copper enzyme maturation permease subunit
VPPILVIARLTIQEASRRRLLLALVVLTLIVVGFSAWGFHKITEVTAHDEVTLITSQLLIVVTFMYSGVLALSAAVVAGPLISSEVESGLLLSMLARPVRRSEVVIGKWLGLAALVAIYASGSALLELSAVDWATGYLPPHPVELVLFVGSEGLVLLSLGLVLSTRLSGITGGVIALVAWLMGWIGGVVGDIGASLQNQAVENIGIVSHLILPSDGLWRGAVYAMEPDVVLGRHHRQGQSFQRRRSSTARLSRVGGGVVRGDAGAEHLELPDPRDIGTRTTRHLGRIYSGPPRARSDARSLGLVASPGWEHNERAGRAPSAGRSEAGETWR